MCGDNDVLYQIAEDNFYFKNLPNLEVPREKAHVKHLSWTDDKAQDKIKYHISHFGTGTDPDACSYKWNEERGTTELNLNYYAKMGKDIPIIHSDN